MELNINAIAMGYKYTVTMCAGIECMYLFIIVLIVVVAVVGTFRD